MLEMLNIANEYKNLPNFTMKHYMLYVMSIKKFKVRRKFVAKQLILGLRMTHTHTHTYMEKNLVMRQTKNVQQMHLFVERQPKNARQRHFNIIQHLHRKTLKLSNAFKKHQNFT
jgi:hypothetical protein